MDYFFKEKMVRTAENRGFYHTIEAGDTLYKIARRYNLRVYDLLRANPDINVYNLQRGERILIPAQQPQVPNGKREHIVRSGDTLMSILTENNLSYGELEAANKDILPIRLTPGIRLWLPVNGEQGQCANGTEYIMRNGDTVESVAATAGTTVDAILMANPSMRPNQFVVGARLCLPENRSI